MNLRFQTTLLLILALVLCSNPRVIAQTGNSMTIYGSAHFDRFGFSVSGAGDVNGDGFDDVVVGTWSSDLNGLDSGSAHVYSGIDGSLIFTFLGDSAGDEFGRSVSGLGDVNGDGFDDIIAGAWGDDNNGTNSGSASVFSGFDGSVIYQLDGHSSFDTFGYSVSQAGDVNADGIPDFVVGAPDGETGPGSVRIYSGIDATLLYTFHGSGNGHALGMRVSSAGDVNADGFDDVIVGTPFDGANGQFSGSMRVYSGSDGSILHSASGSAHSHYLGSSVSGVGDVNGDGFGDFLVGAEGFRIGTQINFGRAWLYSGVDGSTLYTFTGNNPGDYFGTSVSNAGDVNGDGVNDFIIGAGGESTNGSFAGSALVYSGVDGSVLHSFLGDSSFSNFGSSVSGAGDVNGDGFSDVIVGAGGDNSLFTQGGSARLFVMPTLPVLVQKTQGPGFHQLDISWTPDFGDPLALTGTISCTGATPGALGLVLSSLVDLDYLAFGYLPLLVDIDPANLIYNAGFGFDAIGELHFPGVSRQIPVLAGSQTYVQFFETSPVISSSPAIRFDIAP